MLRYKFINTRIIKNIPYDTDLMGSRGKVTIHKLIPGANQTLKVTIKYWVTTKDSNLSKGYTWIPQEITKTISLGNIEMNKSYGIVMHLGLTSVKFTATVSDWVAAGSEVRADLPVNVVAE